MAAYVNPHSLVSADWLESNLDRVKVVDGSWYLPAMNRDPKAEFEAAHIPGAVYFDIDQIADADSSLPHTLPDAAQFGAQVGALGIANDDHVVVYDGLGLFSAGRVWWMFRYFGHDKVGILDGGFAGWQQDGRPTDRGADAPPQAEYTATARPELLRSLTQMKSNLESAASQVVDARSRGRFTGEEPEFRAGLRSGHIPGSLNLPVTELNRADGGGIKPADELLALTADAGIKLDQPIITTCGSGVSACAVAFALHLLGKDDVAMYDGSWTEWGGRDDTPVGP